MRTAQDAWTASQATAPPAAGGTAAPAGDAGKTMEPPAMEPPATE